MPYGRWVATGDSPADVAELVDALVSGTSGSNVVGVQVSPSASKPLPRQGLLNGFAKQDDQNDPDQNAKARLRNICAT